MTASSPIFVVGAPRSGTSLMRLILNAHSAIAIPGETSFFPSIFERYGRRPDPLTWPDAVDAFVGACEARFRPAVGLAEVRRRLLDSPPDFARLLSEPLSAWASAQGKQRWGEKTPTHIFYADEICSLFPSAQFVEMLRDPRAVVASMNRFRWTSDDTVLNARYWRDVIALGRPMLSHGVPADQRHTVRYEDLVADPAGIVREVCRFLGEPFEEATLEAHRTAGDYVREVSTPKILEPVSAGRSWQQELRESEVAIVEYVCGRQMADVGYEPEVRKLSLARVPAVKAKLAYVSAKQWQHRDLRYHPVMYRPRVLERFRPRRDDARAGPSRG